MLDNRQLEALAAVIEEGGFDKAAARLHITQSAVSQRVRNLEEHLGVVLVARTTPPEPTPAGRELIKHLRKIRLLEHELATGVGIRAASGFTQLPVGVNADSLATWFLDAVEGFAREQRVLFDLHVDDENQTQELLRRGEVVGCLGASPEPLKGCRSDYLGTMDYVCVCTPAFRQAWFGSGFTPDSVAEAPAVLFNRKDQTHARMLANVLPGASPQYPRCYVPSSESFVDVVRRGLAYGMAPEPQVRRDIASGHLEELLPRARMPVALYWQSWNMDTPLLTGLRTTLIGFFQSRAGA